MNSEKHDPHEKIESLLNRLEDQLESIETDEFIRGLSHEELQEKGFVGNRSIVIDRAPSDNNVTEEGLLFANGVEFIRLEKGETPETVSLQEIKNTPVVNNGALFATRPAGNKIKVHAGKNVRCEMQDQKELFFAEIEGVVVFAANTISVCSIDVDCTVQLTVSEDRMKVTMKCIPGTGKGAALTAPYVIATLEAQLICYGIDQKAITRTIADLVSSGEPDATAIIAQGTPAVAGKNGRIEYAFSENAGDYNFKIQPDGKVDYRTTCNITMTEKGALLATRIPPQPGTCGTDVFGRPVPLPDGIEAVLIAGNGVLQSEDGMRYFSDATGSITLNDTTIEVLNTYVVNGDVDYASGNIHFNGNVVIQGTVLDGFEIKAAGDIIVAGNVESATLEAGRDVIIRGGVLGRGKGLIAAGRNIVSGYVQNARLEAQGDARIGNYAINSYICTSGKVIVQDGRGSIMGGEIFAQKGVDARSIGSENGVKTCVTAGTDYLVQRKIAEVDLAITFCSNNIKKIDQSLKSAMGAIEAVSTLPADRRALLQKVIQKRKDFTQSMAAMMSKREDLILKSRDTGECTIKVSKECFADVCIRIKDLFFNNGAKRCAVRFFVNSKTGEIASGPY